MTAHAETSPTFALPLGELLDSPVDEFDLDIRWGELGQAGPQVGYLPTAGEKAGETCDTHAATCPATCHVTCPATCVETCHDTCKNTCADTCHHTCVETCAGTCAGTHCFTCRCNTP